MSVLNLYYCSVVIYYHNSVIVIIIYFSRIIAVYNITSKEPYSELYNRGRCFRINFKYNYFEIVLTLGMLISGVLP